MKSVSLPQNTRQNGFTLLELLIVMGIMIFLAGAIVAGIAAVNRNTTENQTQLFMAELDRGLEAFKLDNGSYPLNPPGDGNRDTKGLEGSSVLYLYLSGDRSSGGSSGAGSDAPNGIADQVEDEESTTEIYVSELAHVEGSNANPPRSIFVNGQYLVVDAFGNPLRYLAEAPNISPEDRKTINPTFDLWSQGASESQEDIESEDKFITNW